MSGHLRIALTAFMLLFLLVLNNHQLAAQKDDTLYFLNDDRISGEIRQFKYGYLTYKTYGVSTVNVKYDKISTFYSKKSFDILLANGIRRFGSIDTSNLRQFVKIITANDTLLTPLLEIVEITPINKSFWTRLTGSVDIGFSYTRANALSKFSLTSDIVYTQRKYIVTLGLNSQNSIQQNVEDSRTKWNDIDMTLYYRLRGNWLALSIVSAEQNTQLGLNLRAQGGLGIGNEIIHTNTNNLLAMAGVVVNREWSADTSLVSTNIDGFVALQYKLFHFTDPEIDITSNGNIFPSLNVANRWRANYDIKLKFKIITDMFLSFTYQVSYDSKPPSLASSKLDYSMTTSFGYSF